MASEEGLPERLQWTLDWQTRELMPVLQGVDAEQELRAFWRSARRMAKVVEHVALSGTSLSIDVGGGLTTPLRWLPGRTACVDPLAEHYASRFPLPVRRVTYLSGQGEDLPFVSGTADLVVCTNCIDHTDDPHAVVRELARVLRPGGWLWLTCEESLPTRRRNAGHPHSLDRGAIRDLVRDFEVVLDWEEPWRGIIGHMLDRESSKAMELGFLARKPRGAHA